MRIYWSSTRSVAARQQQYLDLPKSRELKLNMTCRLASPQFPETHAERIHELETCNPRTREGSGFSRIRRRLAADFNGHFEVTVPSRDAPLVRAVAGAFRSGWVQAEFFRRSLQLNLTAPTARTGSELVVRLCVSHLAEVDLQMRCGSPVDFHMGHG